jgi:DNA replication protein DnaC
MAFSIKTEQVCCAQCGISLGEQEIGYLNGERIVKDLACNECVAKWEENERRQKNNEMRRIRIGGFQKLLKTHRCEQMEHCDPEKLPCGQKSLTAVQNHDLSKGLVIHGKTGMGKTRLLWQLAKRIYIDELQGMRYVRDSSLGRMIERSYADGQGHHDQLIDELSSVPYLLIDDLGKAKLTARVESDLFDILDARYSAGKPFIITTQFTGYHDGMDEAKASLESRFSTWETGEAVVRRIRETCRTLALVNDNESQQKELL